MADTPTKPKFIEMRADYAERQRRALNSANFTAREVERQIDALIMQLRGVRSLLAEIQNPDQT